MACARHFDCGGNAAQSISKGAKRCGVANAAVAGGAVNANVNARAAGKTKRRIKVKSDIGWVDSPLGNSKGHAAM